MKLIEATWLTGGKRRLNDIQILRSRKPGVFELTLDDEPFDEWDARFAVMALCPKHRFLVTAKRPERMAEYFASTDDNGYSVKKRVEYHMVGQHGCPDVFDLDLPMENVCIGVRCENQDDADNRIPYLLRCPAVARFLSFKPLGELDLLSGLHGCRAMGMGCDPAHMDNGFEGLVPMWPLGIHWVVVAGGSRPCNIDSIRSIRDQCKAAGVPCFVKQLGKWIAGPHEFPGWQGVIDRWLLRDEDGREGIYRRPVIRSEYSPQYYDERPANAVAWGLNDPKGRTLSEWPEDLRAVREIPELLKV